MLLIIIVTETAADENVKYVRKILFKIERENER